ncbi:hypothetical protein CK203_030605 [Vitis vinifera]|uniref:Uncharacterized protein n=1 Tax=Vitis vinifera TaxID=29760 RepID=A0A438IRG6_VITVI|nr:hypothetical protein CK203_030605 [Vitis vinifera]
MHSRGPNHRLFGSAFRSQVLVLMLAMLTPWHGFMLSAANDTLKIIACREQHKKLAALEMELAAAQQEDFASKNLLENKGTPPKKKAFSSRLAIPDKIPKCPLTQLSYSYSDYLTLKTKTLLRGREEAEIELGADSKCALKGEAENEVEFSISDRPVVFDLFGGFPR